MTDPSKIVVAGDFHGNRAWACKVARALPELLPEEPEPLILQVGDFGIWPGRSGRAYLADLTTALQDVGGRLWFVHGNHEDHAWLASRLGEGPPGPVTLTTRITWLPTGTRWCWHGRTWVAVGGAVSVDRALRTVNVDWWPAEELTEAQAAAVIADGPADVVLTHDCPSGTPLSLPSPSRSWALADLARSQSHRERVRRVVDGVRPRLVLHGHYHLAQHKVVDMTHGPVDVVGLDMDEATGNVLVLDVRSDIVLSRIDPVVGPVG